MFSVPSVPQWFEKLGCGSMSVFGFNLNSEMRTTEYAEYTEAERVEGVVRHIRKMCGTNFTSCSFSEYSGYSVVRHLPFHYRVTDK